LGEEIVLKLEVSIKMKLCLDSIAIVGCLKKMRTEAVEIEAFKQFGTWSDGADWAMAGQRLCLLASAHSSLALKVCTDGVLIKLNSAFRVP
jgi:hypothetical protein